MARSDLTYEAAKATRQALVVNLPNNLGIGGAVQTGFKWAARNGYRVAVQFDGDGQHIAAEIPKLLDALDETVPAWSSVHALSKNIRDTAPPLPGVSVSKFSWQSTRF